MLPICTISFRNKVGIFALNPLPPQSTIFMSACVAADKALKSINEKSSYSLTTLSQPKTDPNTDSCTSYPPTITRISLAESRGRLRLMRSSTGNGSMKPQSDEIFSPGEQHDETHDGHGENDNDDFEPNSHWYGATITDRRSLTPTVTGLTLRVDSLPADPIISSTNSSPFTFWPGQWVDFYVPALDKIGGYSLTSIPRDLPALELAVKASRHPVAQHVTEKACVGDRVRIRVGGKFVYDREASASLQQKGSISRILFVAGGVGINPLFGMMQQIYSDVVAANKKVGDRCKIEEESTSIEQKSLVRVALLYSSSCKEELMFMPELSSMTHDFPSHFKNFFTVTQSQDDSDGCGNTAKENENGNFKNADGTVNISVGRITPSLMRQAMEWLNCDKDVFSHNGINSESKEISHVASRRVGRGADAVYICGPPGMAEDLSGELCNRDDCYKVNKSDVYFEQWW